MLTTTFMGWTFEGKESKVEVRNRGDMRQQTLNIKQGGMERASKRADMRSNSRKLSRKASHLPSVNAPLSK